MRSFLVRSAQLVLLALLFPPPAAARSDCWKELETANFRFISSATHAATRDVAAKLESMNVALAQLGLAPVRSVTKTTVFLFTDRRALQPYLDALLHLKSARANGAFLSAGGSGAMLIDLRRSGGYDKTLYHELVHELLARRGTEIPLWLNEGLAEYFSSSKMVGGEMRFGQPLVHHLRYLRGRELMPLEKLLSLQGTDAYTVARQQLLFYGQSWLIVHYILRQPDAARKLQAFLQRVEAGEAAQAALQRVYAVDVAALEKEQLVYLRRTSWPLSELRSKAADIAFEDEIAPLGDADVHYELGRVLERGLPENTSLARQELERALTIDPRHARSLAALARLAWKDGLQQEAATFIEQAQSVASSVDELVAVGETLLARVAGVVPYVMPPLKDEEKRMAARNLFARAIKLDSKSVAAHAGWGATFALVRDPQERAIDALQFAVGAAPARADYAMHLYVLLDAAGREAEAETLRQRLDRSSDAQIRFASRSYRLNRLAERASQLSRSGKGSEAARVVRAIAAETAAGSSRDALIAQAESLERLAVVNAEIESYNRAVAQFNRREYRQAGETLDELLKNATDPQVISDAKELRRRVRPLL